MNLYDANATAASPAAFGRAAAVAPVKSFMHLTTPVDELAFNHDSQLLAMASRRTKDSLKLVRGSPPDLASLTTTRHTPYCVYVGVAAALTPTVTAAGACAPSHRVRELADVQDASALRDSAGLQPSQRCVRQCVFRVRVCTVCVGQRTGAGRCFPSSPACLRACPACCVLGRHAGYLSIGNDRGRALLQRLHHYATA